MIWLDTNVNISLINRRDPRVRDRFEAQLTIDTPIVLPAICLFEMRYGYAKSERRASSELQLERLRPEASPSRRSEPKTPRTPGTYAPRWKPRERQLARTTA